MNEQELLIEVAHDFARAVQSNEITSRPLFQAQVVRLSLLDLMKAIGKLVSTNIALANAAATPHDPMAWWKVANGTAGLIVAALDSVREELTAAQYICLITLANESQPVPESKFLDLARKTTGALMTRPMPWYMSVAKQTELKALWCEDILSFNADILIARAQLEKHALINVDNRGEMIFTDRFIEIFQPNKLLANN